MTTESGPDQRLARGDGSQEAQRLRQARRASVHGMLVAIDAPGLSSDPWVVDAIDISSKGLGLVLPPELLEGTEVLLSFKLGEHDLSRLPATVQYRAGVSGGVRFDAWTSEDRRKLLEYLVAIYESHD